MHRRSSWVPWLVTIAQMKSLRATEADGVTAKDEQTQVRIPIWDGLTNGRQFMKHGPSTLRRSCNILLLNSWYSRKLHQHRDIDYATWQAPPLFQVPPSPQKFRNSPTYPPRILFIPPTTSYMSPHSLNNCQLRLPQILHLNLTIRHKEILIRP